MKGKGYSGRKRINMGMSDKQYDGMLLDFLEDFEDIEAAAKMLPDCPEKEKLMEVIARKKKKTERKLEVPIRP